MINLQQIVVKSLFTEQNRTV